MWRARRPKSLSEFPSKPQIKQTRRLIGIELGLCAPFIDQLRHYFFLDIYFGGSPDILRVGGINGFSDVKMWRAIVWTVVGLLLGLICNLANSAEIRPEYFPGLKQNGVKAVSIRVIRIVGFQKDGL